MNTDPVYNLCSVPEEPYEESRASADIELKQAKQKLKLKYSLTRTRGCQFTSVVEVRAHALLM